MPHPKGALLVDPRKLFADQRLDGCVYCGGQPSTRDHVPSRVLLDKPYPDDLPVVGACADCNEGLSLDEEYVACLVECAIVGSTNSAELGRPKIRRILAERPALRALLESAKSQGGDGALFWQPDAERVQNVLLKLARGHAAYQCAEPMLHHPSRISFSPISLMSVEQLHAFETPANETMYPEVGSRAFCEVLAVNHEAFVIGGWHTVQPGRYRYLVSWSAGIDVRVVLSEYLFGQVVWD
jgi:hypothetical protein